MVVRARPRAELLPVVAHRGQPRLLGGDGPQVGDRGLDVAERDPIAQLAIGAEDREAAALVLGHVRAGEPRPLDRGRPEVLVVEDRPVVAAVDEGRRQVRFPDALGEPGTPRSAAADPLHRVGHESQLGEPVARPGRDGRIGS